MPTECNHALKRSNVECNKCRTNLRTTWVYSPCFLNSREDFFGHGHTGYSEKLDVGDKVKSGHVIGESDGSGTRALHQHYTYKAPNSKSFSDAMKTQLKDL